VTDRKISELTNITGANLADSDEFPVVDTSADETKAITFGELKSAFDTSTGFVRITGDTMTGDLTVPNVVVSGNVDGRDVAADGTKLDGIEASADVTDTVNVTAAGALMDSELTSEASVKALDQGVATTDSPTFAGLTTTADITFGDSDKAIFGVGSDLQIFHNGSHSYIRDTGVGNLRITAQNFTVRNAADNAALITAIDGGSTYLFDAGSQKLATTSTGVDVTGQLQADSGQFDGNVNIDGTITSDGLTVDGEINLLASGVDGQIVMGTAGRINYHGDKNNEAASSGHTFWVDGSKRTLQIDAGGDISFYEDTGTTPKMVWKSADERLGIGTSSPTDYIHIHNTADSTALIHFTNGATGSASGDGFKAGVTVGGDAYLRQREAANLLFYTSDSERMRIDSNGNLLVGVTTNTVPSDGAVISAPSGLSHSFGRDGKAAVIFNRATSDGDIAVFRKDGSTLGTIGTEVTDTTLQADLYLHARSTADSSFPNESRLWLLGGDSGIVLDGYTNAILPTDENSYEDARTSIGSDDYRFKDLYLSGGVYLGGTGSANLLDDYEEGTWTPVISNVTGVGVQTARYKKIGSLVQIDLRITWTGSTGSSGVEISLPFNSAAASVWGSTGNTGAVFYSGTQLFSGAPIVSHIGGSSASMGLYKGDGGAFQSITANIVNGSYDFLITSSYHTT